MTIKLLLVVRGDTSDRDYILLESNCILQLYLTGEEKYLIGEEKYLNGEEKYLIGEEKYLIGEEKDLIGEEKRSNQVQYDSINSNNTHIRTSARFKRNLATLAKSIVTPFYPFDQQINHLYIYNTPCC